MHTGQSTDSHLNRAEILAALDYEITSIEKEQSSPGWTKWTFYGGFATLVWVAITEVAKKDFAIVNAALVLFFFSILVDLSEYFVRMLRPPSTRPSLTNRLKLSSHEFGGSRLMMLGTAIRLSALLGVYYFLRNSSLQYVSGWFMWFYCILFIFLIGGIILSYFGVPVNPRATLPTWGICVLHFACLVPLSIAVYQAGIRIFAIQNSFSASDFRIGLLAMVFLWLLPVSLSHVTQSQPLLDTLKNVRRDLAFDRIEASAALRQADIALDGMRVEDYFQSDLQRILQYLDSAGKSMRELEDRIGEANALVKSWELSPPIPAENTPSPSKMLRAILESCELHRKAVKAALEAGNDAHNKYSKRKSYIRRLVAESELAKIDINITTFLKRLKEQAIALDADDKILRDGLIKLAKDSPHLLPEPRPELK
jgi:hypothetical protein